MQTDVRLVIFLMILFALIIPTVYLVIFRNNKKVIRVGTIILSIVYFSFLFVGFLGEVALRDNVLTITLPFNGKWFKAHRFLIYNFGLDNVLVNIALFFPMAFISFIFCKKHKFVKTILLSFILSVLVEFLQFALPVMRIVELTDLLFNTLGGIVGACYVMTLFKLLKLTT